MHHMSRFFNKTTTNAAVDPKKSERKPRLERRNARKYIDFDAPSTSSSFDDDSSPTASLVTRSLDIYDKSSFRIEGNDGEFELICQSLGLSGPEDFAIPTAAWESRRIRSSSDLLPRSNLDRLESPKETEEKETAESVVGNLCDRFVDHVRVRDEAELTRDVIADSKAEPGESSSYRSTTVTDLTMVELAVPSGPSIPSSSTRGIKGVRPPLLKPPPAMTLPSIDATCSTWDLMRDFAPIDANRTSLVNIREVPSSSDEEEEGKEQEREVENAISKREEDAVLSESCSFTTSNDDDCSSTTTEPMNISPNGRFRRTITSWEKGDLLGRGSFGSVYEGIADGGFFFAVKEVSLLDQGTQGRQSIYQLEQEIALLSQFEHENIVRYYGTDTDESKLYIFLELVTKGSLLNLYQKYHLKDSQVSSYTRQILHGLMYLHERNVVHRDVKCANILVDANGSVKLADFGLAKATKLNDVKSCKGTAFWMAPEVVNNKNQGYGLPADIWSLGCTVLEMLTHQIPYSPLEHMQALFRIGKGIPPPIPEFLSKDAQDFIMQCLQVNPKDRPSAPKLLDHPFVKRPQATPLGLTSPHPNRWI